MLNVMQSSWGKRTTRWSRRTAIMAVIGLVFIVIGGGGVYAALGGSARTAGTSDIDLQKGLVGWWKLDGNFKDASPYANNGTAGGTPTATTDRKGSAAGAYSFNGSSQYVDMGTGLQATPYLTVSAWVNTSSASLSQTAVSRYTTNSTPNGDWFLGVGSTANSFTFSLKNSSSTVSAQSSASYPPNAWHNIVGVYDGSTIRLFVDGTLAKSTTAALGTMTTPTESLRIGARANNVNYWNGSVDDTRVYNRALNTSEITALSTQYNSNFQATSGENGLAAWWRMDGNAKDSSPNASDGTVTSATLTTDRKAAANTAYNFNGTNSAITVPNNAAVKPTGQMSVSFWVKPANLLVNQRYIASTGTSGGYAVYVTPSSTADICGASNLCFGAFIRGSYQTVSLPISNLSLGTWKLITATYDGASMKLYVNAGTPASALANGVLTEGTGVVCIGAASSTGTSCDSNYTNGVLDDVRIYNRALTSSEVAAQYNAYNSQVQVSNLQSGLVADYPFNGNTRDMTPYADNGTGTSLTTTADRKGRVGSAYSFDGTASKIKVNENSIFKPTTGLSISVWYNPADNTNLSTILSTTSGGGGYDFKLTSSSTGSGCAANKICFAVYYGAGLTTISANRSLLPAGTWGHVVVTYDGTNMKMYVNGVQQASFGQTGNILYATSPLCIMEEAVTNGCAAPYGAGSLDDVRIWNRGLTQAEVSLLYNSYR